MEQFINWLKAKEGYDNLGRFVQDTPYEHDYNTRDIKNLGHGKAHPSLITKMGGFFAPITGDEFIFAEPDGRTDKAVVTHSAGVAGLGQPGELRLRTDDGQTITMNYPREYKLGHISLIGKEGNKRTFRVQFS